MLKIGRYQPQKIQSSHLNCGRFQYHTLSLNRKILRVSHKWHWFGCILSEVFKPFISELLFEFLKWNGWTKQFKRDIKTLCLNKWVSGTKIACYWKFKSEKYPCKRKLTKSGLVELKFTILLLANCWKVALTTKSTKTCMIFLFLWNVIMAWLLLEYLERRLSALFLLPVWRFACNFCEVPVGEFLPYCSLY